MSLSRIQDFVPPSFYSCGHTNACHKLLPEKVGSSRCLSSRRCHPPLRPFAPLITKPGTTTWPGGTSTTLKIDTSVHAASRRSTSSQEAVITSAAPVKVGDAVEALTLEVCLFDNDLVSSSSLVSIGTLPLTSVICAGQSGHNSPQERQRTPGPPYGGQKHSGPRVRKEVSLFDTTTRAKMASVTLRICFKDCTTPLPGAQAHERGPEGTEGGGVASGGTHEGPRAVRECRWKSDADRSGCRANTSSIDVGVFDRCGTTYSRSTRSPSFQCDSCRGVTCEALSCMRGKRCLRPHDNQYPTLYMIERQLFVHLHVSGLLNVSCSIYLNTQYCAAAGGDLQQGHGSLDAESCVLPTRSSCHGSRANGRSSLLSVKRACMPKGVLCVCCA